MAVFTEWGKNARNVREFNSGRILGISSANLGWGKSRFASKSNLHPAMQCMHRCASAVPRLLSNHKKIDLLSYMRGITMRFATLLIIALLFLPVQALATPDVIIDDFSEFDTTPGLNTLTGIVNLNVGTFGWVVTSDGNQALGEVTETGLNVFGGTRTTTVGFSDSSWGASVELHTAFGGVISSAGFRASNIIRMTYDEGGAGFGNGAGSDFNILTGDAKITMNMFAEQKFESTPMTSLSVIMTDVHGNTIENVQTVDRSGSEDIALDFLFGDFIQTVTADGTFDFAKVASFSWLYDGSEAADDAFIDVLGIEFTPTTTEPTPIPAPFAVALLSCGMIVLGVLRRR